MTITVVKPTTGHTYHYYEMVRGKRNLLGKNTTGQWALSSKQSKRGNSYIVTATDQQGKVSDASQTIKT